MEKLISINNSSESLEKSIGVMYTNIKYNPSFYDSYDILVFYGDNLPKTNKEVSVTGTVGFYDKYMSDFDFEYIFDINGLWFYREIILNDLVKRKIITVRNANRLINNYSMFSKVIQMMPVYYLYPNFYNDLLEKIKLIMPNVTFKHLDLFDNCEKILSETKDYSLLYKIYGLQLNGDISIFNFSLPQNEFYNRSKIHLLRSIKKSIALSGNITVFLSQIKEKLSSYDIIGYRHHKEVRFTRQIALDKILDSCPNTILEPKNRLYNRYFDKYNDIINNEERANEVAANAYYDFVKENVKTLKIK